MFSHMKLWAQPRYGFFTHGQLFFLALHASAVCAIIMHEKFHSCALDDEEMHQKTTENKL